MAPTVLQMFMLAFLLDGLSAKIDNENYQNLIENLIERVQNLEERENQYQQKLEERENQYQQKLEERENQYQKKLEERENQYQKKLEERENQYQQKLEERENQYKKIMEKQEYAIRKLQEQLGQNTRGNNNSNTVLHDAALRLKRLTIGDTVSGPVAFSAFLNGDINNVPAQHLIKMTNVKLNEGNGYNLNDGIFVSPKAGLYLFHWSGMAVLQKYFYLNLMVNGQPYAQIHVGSGPSYEMSSNTALVRLNIGDHVLIETAGPSSSLHGSYCSFLGVRLSD